MVRSEKATFKSECLTCTLRASCCSERLSWAQVSILTSSSVRNREKRGDGVREYERCYGICEKEKYVCISMKGIWCNLDGPSKNKELWSYVVKFEFSRPKVAQIGRSKC